MSFSKAQKSYSASIYYHTYQTELSQKSEEYAKLFYHKGNIKTEFTDETSTETIVCINGKVNCMYKKGKTIICGEGSAEEMKSAKKEKELFRKKNVIMQEGFGTQLIAGYMCEKMVIRYEYKLVETLMEGEIHVWYTKELPTPNNFFAGNIDDVWVDGEYQSFLKKINGFILKQEFYINSQLITYCEVTDLSVKELEDEALQIDQKNCKKIFSLKAYNNRVNSYRKAKDSQQSMGEH